MYNRSTKSATTQRPNQPPVPLNQKKTASIPKPGTTPSPADYIKSFVRSILFASPAFPRLYADVVRSQAPNSHEARILAQHYKKICDSTTRTHMSYKNCTHIKVTGVPCGSPALRGEPFCYFHQRMLRTVNTPDSRVHHAALLEDEEAIQVSLMEVVNGLIRGTIEVKRGELILRALNTAVRNIRRAKFDIHPDRMVREVPTYPEPSEPKPVAPPTHVGTAAPGCPGGPEVSGRSAVARALAIKPAISAQISPPAQPKAESPTIDPTRPKPPLGVKEVAAPKQRKIAARRASGG